MKYTVIYNDYWQYGSNRFSITKIKRVDLSGEKTISEQLEKMGIYPEYIFFGWSPMVGEDAT